VSGSRKEVIHVPIFRGFVGGHPICGAHAATEPRIYSDGDCRAGVRDRGEHVVNTVVREPVAFPEPERLVQLELSSPQGNGNITSIPKFNLWREQLKS
jgi:uncharacterized protein (DUF2237 family)